VDKIENYGILLVIVCLKLIGLIGFFPMAAPAEIARANGKKGGRPKGSIDPLTAARKEAQRLFVEQAAKHIPEVIDALIHAATGVIVEQEDKNGNTRVYSTKPDVQAINTFFDRIMGKPTQPIDMTGTVDVNNEIGKQANKLLEQLSKEVKNGSKPTSDTVARNTEEGTGGGSATVDSKVSGDKE